MFERKLLQVFVSVGWMFWLSYYSVSHCYVIYENLGLNSSKPNADISGSFTDCSATWKSRRILLTSNSSLGDRDILSILETTTISKAYCAAFINIRESSGLSIASPLTPSSKKRLETIQPFWVMYDFLGLYEYRSPL